MSKEVTEVEIKPDANWEAPKALIIPEPKKRKSKLVKLCSTYNPVEEPITAIDIDDDDDDGSPIAKAPKLADTITRQAVIYVLFLTPQEVATVVDTLSSLSRDLNSPVTPKGCYLCKKQNTKRCSRCKNISYCGKVFFKNCTHEVGKECQFRDWERHRKECKVEIEPKTEVELPKTPIAPPTPKAMTGASVVDAIVIDDD